MFRTEGFRKYFKNTLWMFAERTVRLVVVLLTGVLVARYLGVELFGQLNYATGFVALFFALSAMGLDEIVVRDLVRHPERHNELLGSAAVVKMGGSLLLVIVVMLCTWIKGMDHLTAMLVLITATAELMKPFTVIEYYYQANVQARKGTMVMMVQLFLSAAVKILLVVIKAPLIWFAWVYVIEQVVASSGYLIMYAREDRTWRAWRVTRKMCAYILQQSWPLVVYGVALYIQARIDQVMIFDLLKKTMGEEAAFAEVGQYSAALKMIEALGFMPYVIQRSLAPAITNARMKDKALYKDRLLNQYRFMFVLFLVTSVPLYLLAEPIMVFLYGEDFRPAGVLLGLFAIRLFFTNMGMGKVSFITNKSLFKYSLVTAIIGAGLNIAINFYTIPLYKSTGAIWATIISFFISIFIVDLFFKRARPNFGWMMQGIATFWKIRRVN